MCVCVYELLECTLVKACFDCYHNYPYNSSYRKTIGTVANSCIIG